MYLHHNSDKMIECDCYAPLFFIFISIFIIMVKCATPLAVNGHAILSELLRFISIGIHVEEEAKKKTKKTNLNKLNSNKNKRNKRQNDAYEKNKIK